MQSQLPLDQGSNVFLKLCLEDLVTWKAIRLNIIFNAVLHVKKVGQHVKIKNKIRVLFLWTVAYSIYKRLNKIRPC